MSNNCRSEVADELFAEMGLREAASRPPPPSKF